MRPIVMDMHGFASFREQTRVDFADADFFALVGPTGAGKSTVIDAMTFALYGSVPRWGRKGMVSLALAPTVARATVKLVFEVDRQRYVVARELRRMGTQVSQKAATLERILDPAGLANKDDKTVPMAKDLTGVNDAVERLLGLSYEDFIQCVVLPQGQFADFLHAKPADRQAILLRLLGAEHYKQMMMKANQRSSAASQRAETISESLLAYADATEEAETRSREAEAALAALAERVAEILPRIGEGLKELSAAEDRLQRLRADQALLSTLLVPDGIGALDAALVAGRGDVARLRDAEHEAEAADTAARESLAAGPQRAPLERARERRIDRRRLQESLAGLEADAAQLGAHAHAASAAVETGAARLEELRVRRDDAARKGKDAAELVDRLQREHDALASVTVPDSITVLDERYQAATIAVADATRAVSEAEQRDTDARSARDGAISAVALAQATRDLVDLQGLLPHLEAASDAFKRACDARVPADTALAKATEALSSQRDVLEAAQRAHVIAGLRPHLVAGEACPLCEQTVTALPRNIPMTEVDDARSGLAQAERSEVAARTAAANAAQAIARADTELRTKAARQTALVGSLSEVMTGPLADAPMTDTRLIAATDTADERGADIDPALIDRALAETAALVREREVLDQVIREAANATETARARLRAAQTAERTADTEVSDARTALRQARDPLVQLGAPPVDDASLAASWTALTTWAEHQQAARAADLATATEAAATTDEQHRMTATGFSEAEQELSRQRADANAAVIADQQGKAKLNQVTELLSELAELLHDAPDDGQIAAQLALLDQLEDTSTKAGQALRAARAERAKGETALAALERDEREARIELSAARDRMVALGAVPALDALGLQDSWHALLTWAADQAALREQQARQAAVDVAKAIDAVRQLTGRLSADLAENGIELAPDTVAAEAASAVAAAFEHARGATARLAERRVEAAGLRSREQAARAEQQVAGMLGDLLRADNFQRWLVNAAADDLVAEASATLSALSSGQFDLVYDDGDFYVIDHSDADARRSVRTLSGGETFQASLALALALSSQVSALAAVGAAHLDSIFLDEGFGTLDPETLEVVATTLETLAQGERMVGVVTHVAALAERVPVRFRVTRNARTSTIVREGFEVAAEDEVMA